MDWVIRHHAYVSACARIAVELERSPTTSAFKQDPDYRAVVGNDTRGAAVTATFYDHCRRLAMSAAALHAATAVNDQIGSPVLHPIGGYDWSAGSLRYFQVSREIVARFGTTYPVVEIGGGYGGQRVLLPEIPHYTLIDLPEAIAVQRAYLAVTLPTRETRFCTSDDAATTPDHAFLISDFALSELALPLRAWYLTQLVGRCRGGRLTVAADTARSLMASLRQLGFAVQAAPEFPVTSPAHANIVIWFATGQA